MTSSTGDPIVTELFRSGSLDGASQATKVFLVQGASTAVDARDAVLAVADATFNGLPIRIPSVEPENAVDAWIVTAPYTAVEFSPLPTGEFSTRYSTTGGTQRIVQAIANVNNYARTGDTAPDFAGAINVTENGAEGVDIVVPRQSFSISEPKLLDGSTSLGTASVYWSQIGLATGTVNNATFRGYDAGTLLFLGAEGERRGRNATDLWDITYSFEASPAVTRTYGDIPNVSKGGHEYLWFRVEDEVDETAGRLVKRATSAHVDRIYAASNFSSLGITSE